MDVNVLYGINIVADVIPQREAVLKSSSVIGNSYQDVEPIYSEPDQLMKKSVYITNRENNNCSQVFTIFLIVCNCFICDSF